MRFIRIGVFEFHGMLHGMLTSACRDIRDTTTAVPPKLSALSYVLLLVPLRALRVVPCGPQCRKGYTMLTVVRKGLLRTPCGATRAFIVATRTIDGWAV